MRSLNRRLVTVVGVLSLSFAACVASLVSSPSAASAQIGPGEYLLFQPHQPGVVGRAWANPDQTVEFWAYVHTEYRFAGPGNVAGNRWHLGAERVGNVQYPNLAAFKAAVLAMPEFQGKAMLFEDHSVVHSTVQN
jgi:hypothetical protein